METTRPTDAELNRIAFGEFLRQARERRRLTLEQISDETKIAPRLLTSLEQGNLQPMPKGMYRRAMLRAYAESVGLDTEAALTQFERTFEEPPSHAPVSQPVPSTTAQAPLTHIGGRRTRTVVVAGLALGLAVGVGAWIWSADEEPYVPVQSAVAAAASAAGRPAPAAVAPTTGSASATPAAAPPASAVGRAPRAVEPSRPPAPREVAATSGVRLTSAAPAARGVPARPAAVPRATEGQLVIVSDPPGARVTVNGVGWGSTPLTIRYLPLGAKRVRLTKEGYVSQERTVRVDGERPNATLRLTLKERP